MQISSSLSQRTYQVALDGLAERQRAIAENMANLETPQYLARTVSFEDTLAAQRTSGELPTDAAISSGRSSAPTNQAGNNVQLDEQVVALQDTLLRYQVMSRAVTGAYDRVRTASRTQ